MERSAILKAMLADSGVEDAFTEYEKFVARIINGGFVSTKKLREDIEKERSKLVETLLESQSRTSAAQSEEGE